MSGGAKGEELFMGTPVPESACFSLMDMFQLIMPLRSSLPQPNPARKSGQVKFPLLSEIQANFPLKIVAQEMSRAMPTRGASVIRPLSRNPTRFV